MLSCLKQLARLAVAIPLGLPALPAAADTLRTGGTGATLVLARQLIENADRIPPLPRLEVYRGLGSSGGIAAVADGAIEFSFSGRPLTGEERASGVEAILFARSPFILVSSLTTPDPLRSEAVAAFYASREALWSNGDRVRIILRPRADADTAHLAAAFPGMKAAIEALRARSDIPLAATDQDNLDLAETIPGSLVATTLVQVQSEGRKLYPIAIDGVMPTLDAYEAGRYRLGKDLFLVHRKNPAPGVRDFIAYLKTEPARAFLRAAGALPVGQAE